MSCFGVCVGKLWENGILILKCFKIVIFEFFGGLCFDCSDNVYIYEDVNFFRMKIELKCDNVLFLVLVEVFEGVFFFNNG